MIGKQNCINAHRIPRLTCKEVFLDGHNRKIKGMMSKIVLNNNLPSFITDLKKIGKNFHLQKNNHFSCKTHYM